MSERWRVWAPNASRVDLVTGGVRRAAIPEGGGWWGTDAPDPGGEYGVSLDGGPARPDPRSVEQPRGVHGPSRWPRPQPAPRWFKPAPLGEGLVYELHVGTFTPQGTFDAAIDHLDHLVALGVTHVEIMPVHAFPGRHGWGYDGVNLFATYAPYGGPDGFRRFVDAAHESGLGVILDVVYNHLGPDGNYLPEFGPYFTDEHQTPWGAAVDLAQQEVRAFFSDNARAWIALGCDGLRLDATHALIDDSPLHFLAELADDVRSLERVIGRPVALIAEHEGEDARVVGDPHDGGFGLDALWYDDLHYAVRAAITPDGSTYFDDRTPLANLARAITHGCDEVRRPEWRRASHAPVTDGKKLVGYLQNHDQIGNRPLGERLGRLARPGALRFASALLFVSPFVPMIFQGEEWDASTPFQYFVDHEREQLRRAVREGRRKELGERGWDPDKVPDPGAPAAFQSSILDWRELTQHRHADVLAWYRALAALRRRRPELRDGHRDRITCAWDEQARWFTMQRGPVALLANLGDQPARLPRPRGTRVLAFPSAPAEQDGALVLAPDSVAVYEAP
ncbi:MAG TPA: malto-oligosyltrehalose trehalohydrolase [Kofleriaceae bacterium]|nr:malto-oligosyltrehalose trehalohydrolase [Kofleriaceae bacterium]